MLTVLVLVLVVIVLFGIIFSSMNKTVDKISRETDESAGKPITFFGHIKHFLNLIQLLSIITFYCAILYIGYLIFKLFW